MRWDYLEKKRTRCRGKEELHLERDESPCRRARQQAGDQEELEAGPDAGRGQLPLRQGRSARRVHRGARHHRQVRRQGRPRPSSLTPKQASAQYAATLGARRQPADDSPRLAVDHHRFARQHQPLPLLHARLREKAIKDAYFQFDERTVKNYRVIDADQQPGVGSGAGSADPRAGCPEEVGKIANNVVVDAATTTLQVHQRRRSYALRGRIALDTVSCVHGGRGSRSGSRRHRHRSARTSRSP